MRGWLGCLVCLLLCEENIFNVAEVHVFACNVCLKFPLIFFFILKRLFHRILDYVLRSEN